MMAVSCVLYINIRVKVMEKAIANMDKLNKVMTTAPLTLIHNDCNPRNICLRKPHVAIDGREPLKRKVRMCLYDWELATLDVPQRDVAEFVIFTLSPIIAASTKLELLDHYRKSLEQCSGVTYPMKR